MGLGSLFKSKSEAKPFGIFSPLSQGIGRNINRLQQDNRLTPGPVPFSFPTNRAFDMTRGIATGGGVTDEAQAALTGLLNGEGQQAVRDSISDQVLPQVASMFGQGGLVNSTAAQSAAADAMTSALAPFEYNSRFQAIGMAPQMQQALYGDAAALRSIGAQKEDRLQGVRGTRGQNVKDAAQLFSMLGGLGGSQSQSPSAAQTIGGLGKGITGLLAAGGLLCDRRLKDDIEEVGKWRGVMLYAFRYLWDAPGVRRIGPMAQEVPERARITLPGGWLAVDMGAL